jgi:hypothetical protein
MPRAKLMRGTAIIRSCDARYQNEAASGAELTLLWCFIVTTALPYLKVGVGLKLGEPSNEHYPAKRMAEAA